MSLICEEHVKGACHMKVVPIIQDPFSWTINFRAPLDTSYIVEWTNLLGVHLLALEQWAGNNF